MKRKLLSQMRREWRSNLWLIVELLIISVILWWVADYYGTMLRIRFMPLGYDTEDVYRISMQYRGKDSPLHKAGLDKIEITPEGDTISTYAIARRKACDRLRALPSVQALGLAQSAQPYTYNFYGRPVTPADPRTGQWMEYQTMANKGVVAPGFFSVMNIHGIDGETPEQLDQMLSEGKLVITTVMAEQSDGKLSEKDLKNLRVRIGMDSLANADIIGAAVPPIRRNDYEPAFCPWIFESLPPGEWAEVFVRIRPGMDEEFRTQVKELNKSLMAGTNTYISECVSMRDVRDALHKTDDAQMRSMMICMVFLLVIVFLGMLGTFWFRTQQRVREIAIRKTAGADNRSIFARCVGEGLILLAIASVPAWGLDALIVNMGYNISANYLPDHIWITALCEALVVLGVMALMTVAGIGYPAWRATKVEPADALRGE